LPSLQLHLPSTIALLVQAGRFTQAQTHVLP
jgi:hypothetical protein